ncbi:MAG TPA: type II toxin-antitoxin system HicB family antitoxin [Dehalococcoidia bacterium]|nr:type II toxin-antitoxin system HicB family antitoxin [Dehalococcoidia bacterium]
MKSYIFRVEVEQDEDGRLSAVVPALPGCAVWGLTIEDALEAIQDAAQAYVEILIEDGRPIPLDEVSSGADGAAVAVVA